jgi:hypothetical protein
VDPRSAPETILGGHTPNQVSTGGVDAWSSGTSRATAPASPYALAMPTIDRGRLDQHQRFAPPRPQPPQQQPEQSAGRKRLFERARTPSWWRRASVSSSRSRRVAWADRTAAPVLTRPRIASRVPAPTPTSMLYLAGRNISEGHVVRWGRRRRSRYQADWKGPLISPALVHPSGCSAPRSSPHGTRTRRLVRRSVPSAWPRSTAVCRCRAQ